MYASVSHVRDTRKRETRIHSEDRYRRFLRRAEHVGNAIGARRGIYELLITPNAFRIISHAQGFRYSVARLSSAAATTAFNFSSIASNENRLGNPFPFFFFLFSFFFLSPRKFEIFSQSSRDILSRRWHCPPPRSSIFSSGLALMNPSVIMVLAVIAVNDIHAGRSSSRPRDSRRSGFQCWPKNREWLRVVTQNVWRGREVEVDETTYGKREGVKCLWDRFFNNAAEDRA